METKRITDLTILESLSDAANVLVEENGEAKRVPANKLGGASSWNDLTDKPVVVGGSDTLTWSAITEETYNPSLTVAELYYPVSDAVLTMDDLASGGMLSAPSMGDDFTFTAEECYEYAPELILIADLFFAVAEDDFTFSSDDFTIAFPKAGLYANLDLAPIDFALTVNGYDGFEMAEKIDPAYLPDNVVQNGDTELILKSSTSGSTKQFKITVDDSGTLTATEYTAS